MQPENGSSSLTRWTLAAILLLALLLRLPGHFHPVPFHYDEGSALQEPLRYFSRSLRPDNLRHPALNSYLIFVAEATYYIGGRATGRFGSLGDFFEAYIDDRSSFLYVGRIVPLLAGLLTVLITYHLGRLIWSVPVGLGGALLLAVSPLHIIISNNLHVWSLGTCLATLALLFLVQLRSEAPRQLAVTGIAIGLAIASIYVLGLLLLPLMVTLYIRWRGMVAAGSRPKHSVEILSVGVGVAAGFVIGNFGVLRAWRKVLSALELRLMLYGSGSATDYLTSAWWYIASVSDEFAMGPLLASLVVLGTLWVSWRGPRPRWVALSFVVAVFLIQPAVLEFHASRYTVVAYPVLLLAVSALVMDACTWLSIAKRRLNWIAILALLLLAAPNLLTVMQYHNAVKRTPTRELARQWVQTHLPPGTKLVVFFKHMSPVIPLKGASMEKELKMFGYLMAATSTDGKPGYDLTVLRLREVKAEQLGDVLRDRLAGLAAGGFSYAIHTDPIPPLDKARLKSTDIFREVLDSEYLLVTRFLYTDLTRLPDETATVNPEVRIYRLHHDKYKSALPVQKEQK